MIKEDSPLFSFNDWSFFFFKPLFSEIPDLLTIPQMQLARAATVFRNLPEL